MNTTMVVNNKIIIEENARVAQIAFWKIDEIGDQYDGQWNGLSTSYKQ
jgi:deoxycytidine triphosphate deaminase